MVAKGRPIWALGLISGTSMDGVDAAYLYTDGEEVFEFGASAAVPSDTVAEYRDVLALAAEQTRDGTIEKQFRGQAEVLVERLSLDGARAAIDAAGFAPDVVGFHGQTVFHAPDDGVTVQLGDGGRLAEGLTLPVVWDFRTADMKAGGQGAPFAPFFHHALARFRGLTEPVAFLNLGGVGNVTWVDPSYRRPEDGGALQAFDTGPANALVDDFVRERTGAPFDRDGLLAGAGDIHWQLLDCLPDFPYLSAAPPKSLDRDDFREVAGLVAGLGDADGAATLAAFSARCVGQAIAHLPQTPTRFLVCGGGRKNPALLAMITASAGIPAVPVETIGLDGDMLEALAFAYLAVRVLRGLPTSAPGTTGCSAPVCGGRISTP